LFEYSPLITCRLTDQFGNEISPYRTGAITYTEPIDHFANRWSVGIEGYIAVFSEEERISPPIPFCIVTSFCLCAPKESTITFVLERFHACVANCQQKSKPKIGQIKLLVRVETIISSQKETSFLVPQVDANFNIIDRVCIRADRVFDSIRVRSACCIQYKNAEMQAELSQYSTIADGSKRTFRNDDEMKEYGGQGILSPEDVSFYNVFVNGVLQPKMNYILKKGELTFITQDIPAKDCSVIILFVTWKNADCQVVDALEWQFSAISNGYKKVYVNEDEVPGYESQGIPAPHNVSYCNLYINGVLQPKSNYRVRKGRLELTTETAPTKDSFVILESIIIHDTKGQLFRAEACSYNAYSCGGKIYTDRDEIWKYGIYGVPDPDETSYQNLFVNGILQPHVNYIVQRGCLILKTEDSPAEKAPITLQSVSSRPAVSCGETQLAETTLARIKKELLNSDNADERPLIHRKQL